MTSCKRSDNVHHQSLDTVPTLQPLVNPLEKPLYISSLDLTDVFGRAVMSVRLQLGNTTVRLFKTRGKPLTAINIFCLLL